MKVDLVPLSAREFAKDALEASMVVSASKHTRRAYWTDARQWITFCERTRVDPTKASALVVAAWVEEMKTVGLAPKTYNRRLAALSSIYDWLRRNQRVAANPFSPAEGPKREGAHVIAPTPMAQAKVVAAAIGECKKDGTPKAVRDEAILRILWITGVRRSSLVEITRERLQHDGQAFTCSVPGKGGKTVRLWFAGRAAEALTRWLALLEQSGITTGPVFRKSTGAPMSERDIWRAVKRRGKQAGGSLTPHGFRVAFLTLNPAALDERQDAAAHSSPSTTRLYEREWKGKKAFEAMPEVEDVMM